MKNEHGGFVLGLQRIVPKAVLCVVLIEKHWKTHVFLCKFLGNRKVSWRFLIRQEQD
jgi:hypothetical protein